MNFQQTLHDFPKLIEANTGNFLFKKLQDCHENRVKVYSWVFNISVLVVFVIICFITLYFCAKRKKTPEERERQAIMEQQYILEKIRALEYQKEKFLSHNSITRMPMPQTAVSNEPLIYSTQVPVYS
jgi:flagellar biosynthesis/type III secretory pathway M-ring protein FliF/YscJ